ncbi:MAG: hypothetical protein JNK72_23670 [Myxococcales bacterium]|nr:hypothetical protein [Myxococcales bacterium]
MTFLRQYGPVADNDAKFDEHVLASAKRNGVEALRLDSGGLLEAIVKNFRSSSPRSVILTGTAGDGKTWLCREVWKALGGESLRWTHSDERTLSLPGGATLVVIKDLSEIRAEQSDLLPDMADALFAVRPEWVYLVAANDGQLRLAWERASRTRPTVERAAKVIEDLLVQGELRAEADGVVLYNLSRQDSAGLMKRLLTALQAHEGWSRCNGCPGQTEGCSIWANHERLDDVLLQSRLTDLLTLCDQNGNHLPVRQLLMLASNMLLGHPDGKDRMLKCQEVEGVVRKGRTSLGSIYRNAFGENLSATLRDRTAVFEVLRRFGIGEETNNAIDNLLVYGTDDPELRPAFDELFGGDARYGVHPGFQESLDAYLEGRDAEHLEPFTDLAVAQRQRLFFTTPAAKAETFGLWELTVFRHAGAFLNGVLRPLQTREEVTDGTLVRQLVLGLNRVFTGRLTNDSDRLWLASSGSHSQARVCRIYEGDLDVEVRRGRGISIKKHEGKPALVVALERGVEEALPLHLVRFEFLCRVADGALPSNFSRESYEDILSFKSRLLRRWKVLDGDGDARFSLKLLLLNEKGGLEDRAVRFELEVSR